VDEPGVQLSKGKKIMEGMSLSQQELRTSWRTDDEDEPGGWGRSWPEQRAEVACKLQAALE